MRQGENHMDFEQQLLEQIEVLLHCDGITHVNRMGKIVTAWVTDLVEGKDFKVPLSICFVPCERGSDGERQLQIVLTLSRNVQMEKYRQIVDRLGALNARADIGTLSLFPNGEICYMYQMLLLGDDIQTAVQSVQEVLQMMLMFLFEYYLYLLVLSADPEKMTLEQYQAGGYVQTDRPWKAAFLQEEVRSLLAECLQTECDQIQNTDHGLSFLVAQISDIPPENLEELKVRMHDLSKQTTYGRLAVNDRRQLVYDYACPVTGYGTQQIVQLFTSIAYEMFTFLDIYYPYLIVCTVDPEKMTWSDYIRQLEEQA